MHFELWPQFSDFARFLCAFALKSLLSMRKPLLGDRFKPRLRLDHTPDAILIFVLKARF